MKTKLLFTLIVLSGSAFGQDCSNYFFLQNNKTIGITMYNKKGSETGRLVYSISGLQNNGNSLSATANEEMFDKKGKSVMKAVNEIKCDGGVLMMDIRMNMPQSGSSEDQNTTATATNVYVEYPSTMNVGDHLKDASMNMNVNNKGMNETVSINVTNRIVQGKETVTTPAGTWDCFKITSNVQTSIKTMGIGIPVRTDQTEWFAPGFGIVKTETKSGSTLLTSIK
jgi:DUF3108-like